jgi:Fe2+ transport system protein FeoA
MSYLPRESPVSQSIIPLARLVAGQAARISHVRGRADHVHRLEEFGLRTNVAIRMFRPGNPCIIHLDGNKVCLRADDYLQVLVEPTAN